MKPGNDYIGVAAGALVFNKVGKVLLVKRGPKSQNEIGKWEFSGGSVNHGETREEAAIREIKEEHNLDIEIIELLCTIDHIIPEENQHWVSSDYIARLVSGDLKIMEPGKIDKQRWFKIADIDPDVLTIAAQLFYENYIKKYGTNPPKEVPI